MGNVLWWTLAARSFEWILRDARPVMVRFIRERREDALDLYRSFYEILIWEGDNAEGVRICGVIFSSTPSDRLVSSLCRGP